MGPGTIRCLAHSAWPMLWVRQCALSPYPLLAVYQLIAFLRMALAAVAEMAGITTLRPNFGSRRRPCASERVQVARAHRGERSEHAALRRTREELAVFGVAHGASEAARLSAAEWRAVRARLCMPSTCKSRWVQHTSLQRWLQHKRTPNSSAEYLECSDCIFAVLHHFNVCSLCQHTICATGTARAPMARC